MIFFLQFSIKKELKRDAKPPPPDQYSVYHGSTISAHSGLDVDIIKHTAQFVAKNGQKFLIALTEREKQNPQFDFLKPTHQLFSFFTNLVDAYSKDETSKLQNNINDRTSILNRCGERFEYENMQKIAKKKKEELDEEERCIVQMAQIEWNDFVVVETIDLFDNEDLPAPATFEKEAKEEKKQSFPVPVSGPPIIKDLDIEKLIKEQQQKNEMNQAKAAVNSLGAFATQVKSLIQKEKENEKKAQAEADLNIGTVKCPVCSQYIPSQHINEHLRIELLDPKYREIKQELNIRNTNTTSATNEEITNNLSEFARGRPDIFGNIDEVVNLETKEKKEKEKPKIVWDGSSNTVTRTTANIAMLVQQTKKNMEESMKLTQEKKELIAANLPTLSSLGVYKSLKLNIKSPEGKACHLELDPKLNIQTVKIIITEKLGRAVLNLSTASNVILKDNHTLESYALPNECDLYIS